MAGRILTKIKGLINQKLKKVSVYDHLFEKIDQNKKQTEIHPSFEIAKNNTFSKLFSYLFKLTKESKTSNNGISVETILNKFTDRNSRVLIDNNDFILQYKKSLGKSGLDLGLVSRENRKSYDLRILSLNKVDAYKHSSTIRYHLSNILEELGIDTIRPIYALFDPKTNIDISVYESVSYKKELISEVEKENLLKTLEKKYQKLFSKHPELKGTSLTKISSDLFAFGSKSIFRIMDGPKQGQIIIDTRTQY
ncbi:MAG: hypothetical protein WCX82_00820 [archaeon]|jgi:hypothetical protein